MSVAAGVGSMPGEDFAESLRIVAGQTPDLIAMPELPARGVAAGMTGRAMGLLAELGADLQPAGWRLTGSGGGVDQRRARSLLAQDLDVVEEQLGGFGGIFKVQVAGPWTLAATVERPKGDRILADHGARRDLAQSLVEGVREHLVDVARRLPGAALMLQIDEPVLPAVLAADVPTASGWGRHRAIGPPEVAAALQTFVAAAHDAGVRAVLHSCAPDLPAQLIAGAGFDALSFDLSLAGSGDAWPAAYEDGTDLWPGVIPSVDVAETGEAAYIGRIDGFFGQFGFDPESVAERLVVTPTCGLAGASPAWARKALALAHATAAR